MGRGVRMLSFELQFKYSKLPKLVCHADVVCFVVFEWFRGLTRFCCGKERAKDLPEGRGLDFRRMVRDVSTILTRVSEL
jgi:hypothetical protein